MAKGKIIVETEACKGCMYCISVCPRGVLGPADGVNSRGYTYVVFKNEEACTGCALCGRMCPDAAITVYRG